jgi:hypothetical protein
MGKVIISTKHLSMLSWLQRHYPELCKDAEFRPHVMRGTIDRDDIVIGSIPIYILTACREYLTIEFERRPNDASTVEGMDEAGAYLKRFTVLDNDQLVRMVAIVLAYLIEGNPAPAPHEVETFALRVAEEARR